MQNLARTSKLSRHCETNIVNVVFSLGGQLTYHRPLGYL